MIFKKDSVFYINARKKLQEYISSGGNIDDLTKNDSVYMYIKSANLTDEEGNRLSVEQKFEFLGYPRKAKRKSIDGGIKKILDDFVLAGGDVNSLGHDDELYKYIKGIKMFDEDGKTLTLEEKFNVLGHPRSARYSKDIKGDLIREVDLYLNNGGSFHIERKKLPFYDKLSTYAHYLQRKGIVTTYEQIMKDLGYKQYSEDYYRCLEIKKLKTFRDQDGYVDSYRTDKKFIGYLKELANTYGIPYYFVITLLCEEKLRKCSISVDRVKFTERLLNNYVAENGNLIGLKRKDPSLFYAFEYLTAYYSDGSGQIFSKKEWLDIFGLGEVSNRFKDTQQEDVEVEQIMFDLRNKFPDGVIKGIDLDINVYRKIIRKAVIMGINVKDVFGLYGFKYKGAQTSRLTRTYVTKIPYLNEMKQRRDELIKKSGVTLENGFCKEEVLETRIKVIQQVYDEFKDQLENYIPDAVCAEDDEIKTTMD